MGGWSRNPLRPRGRRAGRGNCRSDESCGPPSDRRSGRGRARGLGDTSSVPLSQHSRGPSGNDRLGGLHRGRTGSTPRCRPGDVGQNRPRAQQEETNPKDPSPIQAGPTQRGRSTRSPSARPQSQRGATDRRPLTAGPRGWRTGWLSAPESRRRSALKRRVRLWVRQHPNPSPGPASPSRSGRPSPSLADRPLLSVRYPTGHSNPGFRLGF